MTWRPIETAPHDGTLLLLRHPRTFPPVFGFWSSKNEAWMTDDLGFLVDHNAPTHWAPLPEDPPEEPNVPLEAE
jgi:hypothetical protein